MRTANPVLNNNTLLNPEHVAGPVMTVQGAINKTGILLVICLAGAAYTWMMFFQNQQAPGVVMPWVLGGVVGGLIFGMATAFKPAWAPVTAPLYAACEGLFLGGLSAILEAKYPGIAVQAVGGTFGVLAVMLVVYSSRLIRVTEKFKMGVVVATGAVALIYLTSMILGFFGIQIPYIHQSGTIGILFSLAVIAIASLNLVLDFDFIERGADAGAPKRMEWYAGFGLLVTLVWLYIEILRLLAKLRER